MQVKSMFQWSVFDVTESSCVFLVTGEGVFNKFYLESGIHRIQRCPPTENRGRRHTSTLAVAVLPYKAEDEKDYPKEDFEIEATKGTGPGGQHKNKTLSAIKITHIPTGLMAFCDSRSQHSNKEKAMAILLARLKEKEYSQKHQEINKARAQQIRDMGRGTRIRTYNFIYDRVTDERCDKKFRTEDILGGKLDLIYKNAEEVK